MRAVGRSIPRPDLPDKLCGKALYLDDHPFPGCLHGVTVRSEVAYGRLRRVVFEAGFPWEEFAVVVAKDIPGQNRIQAVEADQPALAEGWILHPFQPVALLAHPRREAAYEALRRVRVECEPLDPVLTIEDSLALKAVLRPPDNVFKSVSVDKGDIVAGFAAAHAVVEGEYRVPHQEQAYLEPNAAAAWFEADGTLRVLGSLQCPFYVHKALARLFGLPPGKVRVAQAATGGAFGGKEDYPSILAAHAALLAWKSGKAVKMAYDRAEDMAATTKRHPGLIRHRSAFSRDGRLLAQDVDVTFDGGAYSTMTPVVLSRGAIHASGAYECPNVRIRARAVATNSPPNGAFRGFGVPQTNFAAELHMDRAAEVLGLDPLEVRRRNVLKEGSRTATGQVLRADAAASEALELCARGSRFLRRRVEFDRWNKDPRRPSWRGIGISLGYHGGGFTGAGEDYIASKAGVALDAGGELRVLAASTEIGQGSRTVFGQIAADAFGVPFEWVRVEDPDTAKVPDSGPTVASRTTQVVGRLVERAARKLRSEVLASGARIPRSRKAWAAEAERFLAGEPSRACIVEYEPPPWRRWDEGLFRGDAYGCYAFAAIAVELEVDKLTYEVRLLKAVTAQEAGTLVNPALAEGQIKGGTLQGLGYALFEKAVYRGGRMVNCGFTDYVIPGFADAPPVEVLLLGKPYEHGAFGAKGLGELPMDVPAPAAVSALRQATGVWFGEIPVLPEGICEAMEDR